MTGRQDHPEGVLQALRAVIHLLRILLFEPPAPDAKVPADSIVFCPTCGRDLWRLDEPTECSDY